MADIVFASGAIDDLVGPVTAFAPMNEKGRAWLEANGAIDGSYVIEADYADITIQCAEQDGLTIAAA